MRMQRHYPAWLRRLLVGAMVVGCCGATPGALLAQVVEVVEEEAPPELDLETPEFVALQKEYRAAVAAVNGPHRQALNQFIDRHVAIAESQYNDAKRTGNTRDMGTARDYLRIFTHAREQLEAEGRFDLPEKVRRELAEVLEKARREKDEVDTPIAPALAKAEEDMLARFREQVAARAEALGVEYPEAEVEAKLKEFKERELAIKAPPPRPGGQTGAVGEVIPVEDLGPVLASSGEGAAWVTIARWTADMMGMDVITLECGNQQRDYAEDRFSPMGGADSKTRYQAVRPMPPHPAYAYRLKRIPGHSGIDGVMEWPSERNQWRLTFRVKPLGDTVPERHGFDFEVSLPGTELAQVFGADATTADAAAGDVKGGPETKVIGSRKDPAADPDAGKIKLRVATRPAGVTVHVDGEPQVERATRKPLLTPCEILAAPGNHSIRLAKPGFIDKEFKDFSVQPGKRIVWELVQDPKMTVKSIPLKANQPDWFATGVAVKAGDMVVISASGQWSCGDKRDRCGPEGLPNDKRYYKYYAKSEDDVRQSQSIPYGALLAKVGPDGELRAVPAAGLQFKAEAEGEILLDINELSGKERKNNAGKLDVSIVAPVAP